MEVTFNAKLAPKDLFQFNMYQSYTTMQGPLSIFFSILVFVMAGISFYKGSMGYGTLYICGGIIVLIYVPFTLWNRSNYVLRTNPIISDVLEYHIDEEGIDVTQGGETGTLLWDKVYKVIAIKNELLIYSNRVYAYVLPREQVGEENYAVIKKIAESKLPAKYARM